MGVTKEMEDNPNKVTSVGLDGKEEFKTQAGKGKEFSR